MTWPHRNRPAGRAAIWPAGALALLVVLSGATAAPGSAHGGRPGNPLAHSLPPSPFGAAAAAANVTPIGPVGDRFFVPSTVLAPGVVNSVSGLAVDPVSGTVYAANSNAGTVTSFGESNGTLLHSAVVANVLAGSFPFALALDAPNATLYVSVSNRYAGIAGGSPSGWVLALDDATLAVTANYSFAGYPTPPFEPSFLAFDGGTHQLFVENASGGTIAAVHVASGGGTSYIDCGVMECADHGYGLLDIPALHDLVLPTCQEQLVVVNTSSDAVEATIEGPPTTVMAWAAYDARSGMLWVENYTFNQSNGTLLKIDLTTNSIVANIPGVEPREAAMVYDPEGNVLVTSDVNGSEQLSTYNATTGLRVASFAGAAGLAHPYTTLAVDGPHGVVIAGGPGNGSVRSFSLPGLTPASTYSNFPAAFPGVAVDDGAGVAVLLGTSPNQLWGVNESTGTTQYLAALPAGAVPSSLAVDPGAHRAYVADAATGVVTVYDSRNGTSLSAFSPLPVGAIPGMLLADDPTHHRLYVADPGAHAVTVVGLPSDSVLGSVPTPGVAGCAIAADPAAGAAFVTNCGSVGNVTELSGLQLGRLGVTALGPDPSAVAVNGTGTVFVLDGTGTHVEILGLSGGTVVPSAGVNITGGRATALAVDDRDGLLFSAGGPSSRVDAFRLPAPAFAGSLPLRAPSGGLAWDPGHGIVVAPELYAGSDDELTIPAAPGAPVGLVATPGNNTVTYHWAPPASPGAGPVTSYQLQVTSPLSSTGVTQNVTAPALNVTSLTDGRAYLARASAVSAFGTGPSAPGVEATPVGVPYPPTNLSAIASGSGAVQLNWTEPRVDDGAPVTGYTIQVTGGPGSGVVAVGPATSAFVAGLGAGASYRFTVEAVNVAGTGHPSVSATASTPGAASPVALALAVGLATLVAVVAVALLVRRRRRRPDSADGPDETDEP